MLVRQQAPGLSKQEPSGAGIATGSCIITDAQPTPREPMDERLRLSAEISFDNWRDPQNDLEAIRLATPEEKANIERFLSSRGIQHSKDVEALALLDTPLAREILAKAFRNDRPEIRAAVAAYAPNIVTREVRLTELLERIAICNVYEGLSLTLEQIQSDHPPGVIDAMLRRIVRDPGTAAVHFAAMLLHLFGITDEIFDWNTRPFFLRFNPGDETDRRNAFNELCQLTAQDASRYDSLWPGAEPRSSDSRSSKA